MPNQPKRAAIFATALFAISLFPVLYVIGTFPLGLAELLWEKMGIAVAPTLETPA